MDLSTLRLLLLSIALSRCKVASGFTPAPSARTSMAVLTSQSNRLSSAETKTFSPFKTTNADVVLEEVSQSIRKVTGQFTSAVVSLVKGGWYLFPMVLALVPLLGFVSQTPVVTPNFWKMVDMTVVRQSEDALWVIGTFLFSNVFYLATSLYLFGKHPPSRQLSSGRLATLGAYMFPKSKYTKLGLWVLAAGIVSTLFHSVQALGDTATAEAWCYLDHGVAGSTTFYFFKTCGWPSKRVWAMGLLGLVCLSLPLQPGYAFLHSTWHFLSAATAVLWSRQARHRRAFAE